MTVLVPFVVNAGMNFVLGLLIAHFLGPEQFGRYAIGAAIIVLVNTALLDWIRLAAMRFYSQRTRESEPEIRATLDLLSAGISIALAALLVAAVAAGVDFRLPAMLVAAAVLAGIGAGLFDYHGAIARARYLDAAYAKLILVKNLMALILMVGGAWLTRDPAIVLLGSLLSVAVALMTVRRVLADAPLSIGAARPALARSFLAYGIPLVAGNVVYSLMPLMNRSLIAGSFGFAEAGYFSLASDMGLKLFGAIGAALEIVLLREIIRTDERDGRAAALAQIGRNVALVLAVALPVAVGLWLVLPAFEQLVIPAEFRGHFAPYMTVLIPGFAAITILLAAFYPVFLIEKRTFMATFAAFAGLALNIAVVAAPLLPGEPLRLAYAQTAGLILAFAIMAAGALRAVPVPPLRELLVIAVALVAMALATRLVSGRFAPLPELVAQAALGAFVYAAVLLACDAFGLRRTLMRRISARRGRGGTS